MSSEGRDGEKDGKQPHQLGTSTWEWIVAAAGACLVAAILGYMTYYGLTRPDGPPEIVLQALDSATSAGGYLVRVGATNTGYSAAAGVIVAGELRTGEETVEDAEATIDYLPENSAREASLHFTLDPSAHTLHLRVKGFAKP